MRVSVIMGIFNCADTLQEALDSLYAQTFQDFEIILCEDGSTDDTLAVAQRNAASHPHIKLLQNTRNRGLSYSLNRCLQEVSGEYVARMDGDDRSLPDRLAIEVAFLDAHPEYAFVSSPILYHYPDGKTVRGTVSSPEPSLKEFAQHSPFCHAPVMVRQIAYQQVGGYCEKWYANQVEDYHLWMQFYENGWRGYRLTEPLYVVRNEGASTSRRHLRRRLREAVVRFKVCRHLHLPFYCYIYCFKPLVLSVLPKSLYTFLHEKSLRT